MNETKNQSGIDAGQSEFSAGLERWIIEASEWFCDNPNLSDIEEALRDIVGSAVKAEREECAKECERMMMYPRGKQEAPAHNDVWEAAKAIRMRSN